MIETIRGTIKVLKGDFVRKSDITNSYDGLDEDFVDERIDDLVQDGILVNVFRDYYVTGNFESEEREEEATKQILNMSNEIYQEADTRTVVKVSGEMVEDNTFKTDKDPSDIVR